MDRGLCAQLAEHDRVVAAQHQRHDPSAGERAQAGVELLGGPLCARSARPWEDSCWARP
jgi:hypothetical protein